MIDDKELIMSYKRDFFAKTGRTIKVKVSKKWEALCELPEKVDAKMLFELILEFTGITKEQVIKPGKSNPAVTEVRQLITLILFENGMGVTDIGRFLGKGHDFVIYCLKRVQKRMDDETFSFVFLERLVEYIKEAIELGRIGKRIG